MCATFNGVMGCAGCGSGSLLTAEFAFARFVLYTENCHKYTRTNEEHACTYTPTHTDTSVCMHMYAHLFLFVYYLHLVTENHENTFLLLGNVASINSPDTWPFWASPSRRRSKAPSRCDRQASHLFRFQFQLNPHRRRCCRRTTMTTRRTLHSDRAIVF